MHFVRRAGGACAIGATPNGDGEFRFDNETPRHGVLLSDYALANRLVTNAEYLDFIAAGGYRDPKLWLADGWAKIRELGWDRPLCWSEDKAREFTLGGWRQIDPHAPVCHVSYYEADAFARWAGARLPTEAEWELAAAETTDRRAICSTRATTTRSRGARASRADRDQPALGRRLGVVRLELCALPRLRAARGLARRVQRQVHV